MTMPLLFSTLPGIMWKGKRNPALGVLVILLCSSFLLVTGFSETTMATNAWQWYKLSLRNRPLLTKSATSAVVMTISDILTQKMERFMMKHDPQESSAKLTKRHAAGSTSMAIQPHSPPRSPSSMLSSLNDWRRTGDVAITGFVWSGPVSHTWYAILERVVTVNHRILGIVIRLALDATIFSPCVVAGYFTLRSLLEGQGIPGVLEKLQAKWYNALKASWRFWPTVNVFNFAFVPVQFRVLYNNMLSVIWTGYLSHANAKNIGSDKTK